VVPGVVAQGDQVRPGFAQFAVGWLGQAFAVVGVFTVNDNQVVLGPQIGQVHGHGPQARLTKNIADE